MTIPSHLFILTGHSRGLGLAMAQQLLQPGHTVVGMARHTSNALQPPPGAHLEQWQLDLADGTQAAERLHHWLLQQGPGCYASASLINNAGVIPHIAPLGSLHGAQALAEQARALRVGLETPLLLCAVFLQATRAWQVPRKVLNISSGLGRRPMGSQAAYCAAKAGMDHFTRCLALDEAAQPDGARVCSLAPGVIDTAMQVQLRSASAHDFPDAPNFAQLQHAGMLSSAEQAARQVLGWLQHPLFGSEPVADVRHLPPQPH